MRQIRGISFDDDAYLVLEKLIARLQSTGVCEPYGLTGMPGKGELRFAHREPQGDKTARGVFARIISTPSGACLIRAKNVRPSGSWSTQLSLGNLEKTACEIEKHRQLKRPREKRSEKVDPNKPGTVQGGQFESNRREH